MMDKEKLKTNLFSDNTRLFCVLDGAAVPDLPQKLFELNAPSFCLFGDEPEPDVLYTAPFLVHLAPDSEFADFVLAESFGRHWGIFLHTRHSINEMRGHFGALLTVYDEQARPMLFRYYDPRVLRRFLPTCNAAELKTFFGKVETFFAEDAENKSLVSFRLQDNALKQTELD